MKEGTGEQGDKERGNEGGREDGMSEREEKERGQNIMCPYTYMGLHFEVKVGGGGSRQRPSVVEY